MNLVTGVTSDPYQQQQVILPDGSNFLLTMRFVPMQFGWFITELTYTPNDFTLRGLRITASPNMLNQWRNLIPFGLGCFTQKNREPALQQDFSSGAAQLYVLTEAECLAYVEALANG